MLAIDGAILRSTKESDCRMLTGLQLGNFKAFAETQNIPIRPLTLIFGPNSGGKSSILHGLNFARRAMQSGDLEQTDCEGIDLGGFAQYVHRQDTNHQTQLGFNLSVAHLRKETQHRLSGVQHVRVNVGIGLLRDELGVVEMSIATDGEVLLEMEAAHPSSFFTLTPDHLPETDFPQKTIGNGPMTFWIDVVNLQNRVLQAWFSTKFKDLAALQLTSSDWRFLAKHTEEIFDHPCYVERLLPDGLNMVIEPVKPQNAKHLSGAKRKSFLKNYSIRLAAEFLDGLFKDLNLALQRELCRVQHLGPLRWYPTRRILESNGPRSGIDGAGVWESLLQNRSACARVNQSLRRLDMPYELSIRKWKTQGRSISGANLMRELLITDTRNGATVSARDIGVGVSQILPILANAFGTSHHIHSIEQPELHLHPALQAKLGDTFIESALGERKNTFILETHSEHLILRLLRRVRETNDGSRTPVPIKPEDLAVLFVQPTENGSRVLNLPVTPDGDFGVPWPGGFFAERFADLP
ncbi:MAG: AAA family ATPase [Verrucomicrobia bacterium]|nr:AAA family ATPase [Verrucomicrobiota bacterium]